VARRSARTERDLARFGDNILRWRKIQGLTAAMVAERAGITRDTLRSIERGDGAPRLENAFAVLRVLGQTESVITATEPLNTELGRVNSAQSLPQRVRTVTR
jgi:transcriptional regulator with XRE-family HTH domain